MPSARHAGREARKARRARRSEQQQQQQKLSGRIMWLPPQNEIRTGIDGVEPATLDEGCYNHPVVILSPYLIGGQVVVLIVGHTCGTKGKESG